MRVTQFILRFFTHNVGWKALSLLAAVGIWLVVASEPEMARVLSVPVEYKNFPEGLENSSEIVSTVHLETRGPSGLLHSFGDRQPAVILDLSTILSPGERTFTIDRGVTNLPARIELLRAIPAQLRFTFEERASREVTVRVAESGTLPTGVAIVSIEPEPKKLRVVGPKSRVAQVTEVVTDPVDLGSLGSIHEFEVAAYIPERQVRFEGSSTVKVTVLVRK